MFQGVTILPQTDLSTWEEVLQCLLTTQTIQLGWDVLWFLSNRRRQDKEGYPNHRILTMDRTLHIYNHLSSNDRTPLARALPIPIKAIDLQALNNPLPITTTSTPSSPRRLADLQARNCLLVIAASDST